MLLGEGDEVAIEIERGDAGGRVRRIADDDGDRLRDRVVDRPLERREESGRGLARHRADDAARHEEAEGVDRVARIRHQHHVAGRRDRLRHVGEALLGAEGGDHLRVGIELHAETALVIAGLGPAQPGDALRGRVAVGARLAGGLAQLGDHVRRRREVRVAHAEVDDVGAARPRRRLDAVDLLEDVRRQALDAVEIAHRATNPCGGGGRPPRLPP